MATKTKQTAVEWLAEQFDIIVELYPSEFEKINNAIEQAKEMEKQQIKDAFECGEDDKFYTGIANSEEFYNTNFTNQITN